MCVIWIRSSCAFECKASCENGLSMHTSACPPLRWPEALQYVRESVAFHGVSPPEAAYAPRRVNYPSRPRLIEPRKPLHPERHVNRPPPLGEAQVLSQSMNDDQTTGTGA